MALYKEIKVLNEKLKGLEEKVADGWMGKWAKSVMVNKLNSKIKELESKIANIKKVKKG